LHNSHADLAERTIALAAENVERGGRPFSCVVASSSDGSVLAQSPNLVAQTNDPTAHAEVVAIREACQRLGSPNLEGYEIYVMAHPCPMCLGALYYASPDRVAYLVTREEEGRYYTDDQKYFEFENFYDEFQKEPQDRRLPMQHTPVEGGQEVYQRWQRLNS
jgi:tRNA(Arg) A34 adenosine deaminase TadA